MVDGKARHGVGVEDREALQRFEINFGRVEFFGFIRAMRRGDKLPVQTAANIRLENFVRVVEVGDYDVELGKIIRKLGGQFPAAREETRQAARLNRLRAIHQSARERELHDVRVTEDFEVRLGELPAQRSDGRERQNEITDGAAADDENLRLGHAHIARNAVKPSRTTPSAKARRTALPTRTRFSEPVAQFRISRSRHGDTVNHMPATMST